LTWRLPEEEAARLGDSLVDAFGVAVDLITDPDGAWTVIAYFEGTPDDLEIASRVAAALGRWVAPHVEEIADEDWVAKSLAGLGPVSVGRFFVHGAHDRARRPANRIAIEIEAATAFGTGHHGTTAGCLQALSELAKRCRPRNVLDIGTGSGILAIAAAKLWRVPVVATDIDREAVAVAKSNVRLNGAAPHVRAVPADGLRHSLIGKRDRFGLVTANILAEPLIALAPAIAAHLAPRGAVILSGLLRRQRRPVEAAYRARGLVIAQAVPRDDWLTLVMVRPPIAARRRAA
jgi:ribosomal protein L11 methyltransferase